MYLLNRLHECVLLHLILKWGRREWLWEYPLTFLVTVMAGIAAWYQVSASKQYAIYTSLVELQQLNASVTPLTSSFSLLISFHKIQCLACHLLKMPSSCHLPKEVSPLVLYDEFLSWHSSISNNPLWSWTQTLWTNFELALYRQHLLSRNGQYKRWTSKGWTSSMWQSGCILWMGGWEEQLSSGRSCPFWTFWS